MIKNFILIIILFSFSFLKLLLEKTWNSSLLKINLTILIKYILCNFHILPGESDRPSPSSCRSPRCRTSASSFSCFSLQQLRMRGTRYVDWCLQQVDTPTTQTWNKDEHIQFCLSKQSKWMDIRLPVQFLYVCYFILWHCSHQLRSALLTFYPIFFPRTLVYCLSIRA